MQHLQTPVPGHLSSHFVLSSYGLSALLVFLQLSVSLRPLIQALGSCPVSGASWSSAMPPLLGRGRVATTTQYFKQLLSNSLVAVKEKSKPAFV